MKRIGMIIFLFALGSDARGDEDMFLKQSRGVGHPKDIDEWRREERRNGLKPYPAAPAGQPNPADGLWHYGGSGSTSFSGPDLGMPFREFVASMRKQRPAVDRAARAALEARFDLTCRADPRITMSRSKPQPLGPSARLPKGARSWEDYAAMSPDDIRQADNFP